MLAIPKLASWKELAISFLEELSVHLKLHLFLGNDVGMGKEAFYV